MRTILSFVFGIRSKSIYIIIAVYEWNVWNHTLHLPGSKIGVARKWSISTSIVTSMISRAVFHCLRKKIYATSPGNRKCHE